MDNNGANRTQVRRRLTPEQKQKILRMRRKKKIKRILTYAIPAAVVLIAIVLVLVLTLGKGGEDKTATSDAIVTATPTAAVATATPVPTPEPTKFVFDDAYVAALKGEVTGPVLQADMSKVNPEMLGRWPMTEQGYIPVVRQANTNEKIIAITVDDCNQNANLQQIVQCALDYGARLTIFPIGQNLKKDNIAATIKWAWENGMEIENHTYGHVGMYHDGDDEMRNQLYYQNYAVSQVLGVNYQMHWFRPRGGDERNDQRVHAYVNELGYNGIAFWTQSGSNDPLDNLISNLAPGKIYLFHTTDIDLEKLLQFIPAATEAGYKLVTMNEMFGLPENEVRPLETIEEMPEMPAFQVNPIPLQKTLYTRAAAVIQERLIELGWLSSDTVPDGVFGNSNYKATGFFQLAHGREATGVMDVETQKLLFSDAAQSPTAEQLAEMTKAK